MIATVVRLARCSCGHADISEAVRSSPSFIDRSGPQPGVCASCGFYKGAHGHPEACDAFVPLVEGCQFDAYFCGHEHERPPR